MVTMTDQDKLDTPPHNLADLREAGLELIAQHAAAISVIVAALADCDLAYQIAVDARTNDDWQALRDAETRLALLVGSAVGQ